MASPVILWFRDDLRLADNPALAAAFASGGPVLPVFIFDEDSPGLRPMGGASRWWLHHALAALAKDLETRGLSLVILRGPARETMARLVSAAKPGLVVWNRRYGAAEIAVDAAVKADLKAASVAAESFNASLLYEPWEVRSKAGEPLKVFSPFWRAALALREPASPRPAPRGRPPALEPSTLSLPALGVDALGLLPAGPDWAGGLRENWTPGEAGAQARLQEFLDTGLHLYSGGRDRPDWPATSRLSPFLRFGEISPRQAWHAAEASIRSGAARASERDLAKFHSELGWREFSYHLLFHNPDLATRNFQPKFDVFPWRSDPAALRAWQKGLTGYPLVDAGMRQLWRTGWMHNRVRMVVASFLVKHLLIDWRTGEDWFWDTLVDADPANNAASWQWVAGSGADAAPYFRIFNPVSQGEKFDPDGRYVKAWVPELKGLAPDVVHRPWDATRESLAAAGIRLGETYPRPIVDHAAARDRALAALAATKPADESARMHG